MEVSLFSKLLPAGGVDPAQRALLLFDLASLNLHSHRPQLLLPRLSVRHPGFSVQRSCGLLLDASGVALLPALCGEEGDDFNYGSTGLADVNCLQCLSKRIHYGKFVAESKFQAKPEEFTELIEAQDASGLMDLLTYKEVEDRVVRRVTNKAATYGQDISEELPADVLSSQDIDYKVAPERVGELYREWIMPMTKDVQVEYLLRRLDHL